MILSYTLILLMSQLQSSNTTDYVTNKVTHKIFNTR